MYVIRMGMVLMLSEERSRKRWGCHRWFVMRTMTFFRPWSDGLNTTSLLVNLLLYTISIIV